MESAKACQEASIMFSDTPMVVQVSSPLVVSSSTRVTAPVPRPVSSTRTFQSVSRKASIAG